MRLHRNLVFAVIDATEQIFNKGEYADKVVEKVLKRDKRWGARDRGFIAETTYELVRWKRLYEEIAEVNAPYSRANLFRMFAVWATLRGIDLPDWKQIEPTPARRIKGRFDELSKIRKFRESVPDWLDALGAGALGEKLWEKELGALNKQAEVVLRVNTLRTTRPTLSGLLAKEGFANSPLKDHPYALKLEERANVFSSEVFKSGFFEVQDASSQLVAPYLQAMPGQRIVDACAGAGGKTLHLASLMENKGQLIALDIYANKLKELKRRARRNGAHNIEARLVDSTKVVKKLHNSADGVLIDAPCSGLGILRRNPDTKWKLQPEDLVAINRTQKELLAMYSLMVRPGGTLVYATCSILPQENEAQVNAFLQAGAGQEFKLDSQQTIYSSGSGYDGFYMARMFRK
jgi:16S rRNA (cytosine967-C5)-methyltransferase